MTIFKGPSCEYLEDEMSRNWLPVETGKYGTGSGKIHHQNKMQNVWTCILGVR